MVTIACFYKSIKKTVFLSFAYHSFQNYMISVILAVALGCPCFSNAAKLEKQFIEMYENMVVCMLHGRMEKNLMKKIIDGIVYDTEVSKELGSGCNEFYKQTVTLFVSQEENYFLFFENGNIEPLEDEHEARYWVLRNLDAGSCKRIFDAYYTIVAEGYVNNEELYTEDDPESQSWNDIEACFEKICDSITDEYTSLFEAEDWYINVYQPIRSFMDFEGNKVEVYVSCWD